MTRPYESIELTNMCAIINKEAQQVLVQERTKSWKGISFPGGHVELGEAFVPSTIREIKEETGLDITDLKLCGVKSWYNSKLQRRYMVLLFYTYQYSGELINETDEGKVYWVDIDKLKDFSLASTFEEMIDVIIDGKYTELYYEIKDDEWIDKFY